MLWVDKYRPLSLEKVDYHKEQAAQLAKLAAEGDIPHMLFYGPSGAGKKTRVMALLREIFGAGVEKVKLEHRQFKAPSGRAVEMTTVASIYHIEINPGDAGIYDKYVVQELIKEMAQSNAVESSRSWKVLILSEVDRLTKEAQAALRWVAVVAEQQRGGKMAVHHRGGGTKKIGEKRAGPAPGEKEGGAASLRCTVSLLLDD